MSIRDEYVLPRTSFLSRKRNDLFASKLVQAMSTCEQEEAVLRFGTMQQPYELSIKGRLDAAKTDRM